jgi:uncharacterized membrane protein YvlD (DUF360 family)
VIRLLIRLLIALAANAVGLIVAALILSGMELDAAGFIIALVIFTVVDALLDAFTAAQLRRRGFLLRALGALIATLVSLIVTDWVSDGLSINGTGTWVAATVIVWLASFLAAVILPYLGLKKYLEERRD